MISLTSNVQVNDAVLKKVIAWCDHHKNDPPASSEDDSDSRKKTTDIDEWDQKFMQVDQEMLFEIILVSPKIPGFSIRADGSFYLGSQLSWYQGASRCWMQDGRQHD